jgi:hypothetical protein
MAGDQYSRGIGTTRRRTLLAAVGTATLGGLAGCSGGDTTDTDDEEPGEYGNDDTTDTEATAIPGLRLALRADTGVTTDDEGRVETWADQSGNGYDFSVDTPEWRPTITKEAVNGQPALTFDGEDDYFLREDTLGIDNDSPRTFVVVSRLADPTRRSKFLSQGKLDSGGGDSNFYGIEANTWHTAGERFGVYLISVAHDSEHSTDTNYHVHTLRTESFSNLEEIRNTSTYYVDGSESPISHTGGGTFNSPFEGDSTAIGSFTHSNGGGGHFGEIAEIRVYDRALTDDERSTVESTLADRYGLDLA